MAGGFLFDLNKCTGCQACIIACTIENREEQGRNWREVYTFNELHHPHLPLFHLSMACNHCREPVCQENCPALAYNKDKTSGAVTIDPQKCLGCKYCTWVCPYDAPRYNASLGITEKCHFCTGRIGEAREPACVSACPVNALQFEKSQEDQGGDHHGAAGFTQANLKPALRFIPLRNERHGPECTAPPDCRSVAELFESSQKIPPRKIALKTEWALLLFTTIASILAAFFTASMFTSITINPWLFLGSGAVGMGLTMSHLGKKSRAYRAILNVHRSWLSREILLFLVFMGLSGVYLLLSPGISALGWAAAGIGFISLFSIDKIYQKAMQLGPMNFHSAHVLCNGLFLLTILLKSVLLFTLFGSIKILLYLYRKYLFKKSRRKTRPLLSTLRLGFGFLVPVLFFLIGHGNSQDINIYILVVASVISGEFIDRLEYYDELDVITPEKQMLIDLKKML